MLSCNDNSPEWLIDWYIAGPMTGLPEFNYPAFNEAATRLRVAGYTVENPAETQELPSWEDYMRVGLTKLLRCRGIALLPGWELSRGATTELGIAQKLKMRVVTVETLLKAAA